MSRISINKASIDFGVSRNTLYKHIKQGKITKDSDGKLDISDLMRLYSDHVNHEQQSTTVKTINEQEKIHIEYREQLLEQQVNQLKLQVQLLEQQLEYTKQNETWLKQQLDQKLIEQKNYTSKGFLSRLFK